jgi:hypothetical protein
VNHRALTDVKAVELPIMHVLHHTFLCTVDRQQMLCLGSCRPNFVGTAKGIKQLCSGQVEQRPGLCWHAATHVNLSVWLDVLHTKVLSLRTTASLCVSLCNTASVYWKIAPMHPRPLDPHFCRFAAVVLPAG